MKLLVTGASGYVGGGIVRALRAAGHEAVALVRHEATDVPAGVQRVRGDLADAASLHAATERVDGVIHAAASRDDRDGELDLAAVTALLEALAGSERVFVHTSGTWVVGETGETPATEAAPLHPPRSVAWRPRVERLVREAAQRGVRSVIIRPALVYGYGGGYAPLLFAPTDGVVRSPGDGPNRWSVVHVDDLGELYRLAAERAPAGSIYNGVAGVVRMREVAEAAADAAGVRTAVWPEDQAEELWGPSAEALLLDHVVSGERARSELGWRPSRHGLLEELRQTTPQAA